jgi:L-lactate dehydrogenase complex protein LldF
MIVHRASDAEQAREIVLEIASQHDAELVAKSKTMVGEEIDINNALEAKGIRVVETDLGEYIVQLRGEPPAHIITPAVHLRRSEVAATFQEKLGVPYNENIQVMTEIAHRVLRETFLTADIGISGVNFGVAESGTLCVLTNEGNGRMVTTLPRVHIALMGIERMVRTMDDLALMLYLLPRSATGQKITVYTNLINGPRRPDEIDGPDERHLILIDNGRSVVQQSGLKEILNCIRCGACLNACPVFREIGGHAYVGRHGQHTPYPGPIGSVISPCLFGQYEYGELARASSLCGACKEACPVDIDLPKLMLRVRAGGMDLPAFLDLQQKRPDHHLKNTVHTPTSVPLGLNIGLRLFTWVASSPGRFSTVQRLAGFFGGLITPHTAWIKLPAFTGWGYSRDFPRPAKKPFRARFASHTQALNPANNSDEKQNLHPEHSEVPAMDKGSTSRPQSQTLLQEFASELTALDGKCVECTQDEIAQYVIALLQREGQKRILTWGAETLPPRLIDELLAQDIDVQYSPDEHVKVGLTGALAAAAETGTIALPAGKDQPLTASLLPEIHIAVLHKNDIYKYLSQVLNLKEIKKASAAALISGPSRTADIEMTLTIGVHGPREVHVLCLD